LLKERKEAFRQSLREYVLLTQVNENTNTTPYSLIGAKMAQSLSKLYIHAVFSTRNREPLLHDTWRAELFDVVGGSTRLTGCQSLIVGGTADHLHTLFVLPRSTTVSDALRGIKSASSRWINERGLLQYPFQWQNGYAAFSVGQSGLDLMRQYIEHQVQHHQVHSFKDELRELFRRYGVAWDEQYVWS
jgi:REP element-mobilizing transposase RayT